MSNLSPATKAPLESLEPLQDKGLPLATKAPLDLTRESDLSPIGKAAIASVRSPPIT